MDKLTEEEQADLVLIEELVDKISKIVEPKHYNNTFYSCFDCDCMGFKSTIHDIRFKAGIGKSTTSF
jgi:hypothetical protein